MKTPLALLATLALGATAFAQGDVSYETTELAPGLYMMVGQGGFTGGNLGLLTGEDGVVLIDDGMPQYLELVNGAVQEKVGRPVDFLINTHIHGDHVGNNEAFAQAGATIVAHHNIRQRMLDDGVRGPEGIAPPSKDMLPELTFAAEVTLHLNGHTVRVIHLAAAHTDGDAIVVFPEADVIHTGDALFNGMFPYIDLDSGGTVDGYIAAQERMLALGGADTRYISGHGPLASKADVEKARDMLIDARDRVRRLVKAGRSADEIVAANPLADYHDDWNWGFITTERMTRTLVRDAGGE